MAGSGSATIQANGKSCRPQAAVREVEEGTTNLTNCTNLKGDSREPRCSTLSSLFSTLFRFVLFVRFVVPSLTLRRMGRVVVPRQRTEKSRREPRISRIARIQKGEGREPRCSTLSSLFTILFRFVLFVRFVVPSLSLRRMARVVVPAPHRVSHHLPFALVLLSGLGSEAVLEWREEVTGFVA